MRISEKPLGSNFGEGCHPSPFAWGGYIRDVAVYSRPPAPGTRAKIPTPRASSSGPAPT
jgi:hypothetical protein